MSQQVTSLNAAEVVWKEDNPYSLVFNDHYFSKAGALDEARQVFIDANQLSTRFTAVNDYFVIGEIGFGAGRNFLLTLSTFLAHAPCSARLQYIAFESHPLSLKDLQSILSLWPALESVDEFIQQYPPLFSGLHQLSFAQGRVTLYLYFGEATLSLSSLLFCGEPKLENQLRQQSVDAWFLDGFSPASNPNAWTLDLFKAIVQLSHLGTTCSTYSAASQVKRDLQSVGFKIEKKPGFALKRERLEGVLIAHPQTQLQWTPWYRPQINSQMGDKNVIIIGAGLAGCYLAYELAQRGWHVTLLDKQDNVALAASNYSQALLFPGSTASNSPLALLLQMGYAYSVKQLLKWERASVAKKTGLLHFSSSSMPLPFTYLLSAIKASEIAGIDILESAWYLPDTGIVNIPKLCQWLVSHQGITFIPNQKINEIEYKHTAWQVGAYQASTLVLANGASLKQFLPCEYLPLTFVRGQITWVASTESSHKLRLPLCGSGHVIPAVNGAHSLGATFDPQTQDLCVKIEDDIKNLQKLGKMSLQVVWAKEVMHQWVGLRTITGDYFPCVGQVANQLDFEHQFAALKKDAKWLIPIGAPSYPGLYVFSGFGSKGLTTIPLLAHSLAEEINGGMVCIPRKILQKVSPNRFLFKRLIKGM